MSDTENTAATADLAEHIAVDELAVDGAIALAAADLDTLVAELKAGRDLAADHGRYLGYLADEIAHRLDRRGARTATVGDNIVETNAPTELDYLRDVLEAELNALVEAGTIDRELVDRVIVTPDPTYPPARVDKREVNKLKRAGDELRAVKLAVAKAQTSKNARRTITIKPIKAKS